MSRSRPTASEFASSPYNPELEREFFSRIRLANGSWKTTDCRRLDDLNRAVLPFICKISERPLEIMDVAVSSGVGTQEWSDQLAGCGVETRMIGTDLCLEVRHFQGKIIEALLDDNRNVMHLGLFNRGISGKGKPFHMPIIRALGAIVRLSIASGAQTRPFRLVSKAVHTVSLVEDDILSGNRKFERQFHVVRAANILNCDYFPADRLKTAADNLLGRLKPGGLLIVCRTDANGTNHATIFSRQESGLAVVSRLGKGSEVENILLASQNHPLVLTPRLF